MGGQMAGGGGEDERGVARSVEGGRRGGVCRMVCIELDGIIRYGFIWSNTCCFQ